jgi:Ser/Thr protein kinase RdoA (MazF antagonist)
VTPAPAELEQLTRAYGWGTVLGVAPLHKGENQTYVVTTPSGRVVLRRYRTGRYTPTEVMAELEWLAALAGLVPVVPALATRDGTRCVVREGEPVEIYAAFAYVPGNEPDPPTPSDFRRLGRLLRQLHAASARVLRTYASHWPGYERPRYDLATTVDGPLEQLLATPLLNASQRRRCEGLAARLRELYRACDPDTKSFVHADLHFGNVLVADGTWTLLDFDECGFGFHAFDLGTVRFHAKARGQADGWRAFLGGYGEPRPAAAEIRLGTALRMFYTAGKLPLRSDVPELRGQIAGLIERYLSMTERELEGNR